MRKLFSSFTALVLATVMSMLAGLWAPQVWSQQPPIEPVDTGPVQEIVVNDQRYSFDLEVPIDANPMQEAQSADGTRVLAKPGQSDPLGAVYVPVDESNQRAFRYLPQFVGSADAVCPVDQVNPGTLSGNGATWVAAAPEMDLAQEDLAQIGQTSEGLPMFAIPGDEQMVNLFVANNSGQGPNSLVRYVQVGGDNTPLTLTDGFVFAGQQFTATPGAVPALDGLVRVGCAGLFPVLAPAAEQPFTTVALAVNGAPASFEGAAPTVEAQDAPSTPAPGTPESSPPPATAAPPTAVPPTATPTVVPPTATPTAVPPTVAPTAVPATEAPTAVPATEAPTAVPATEAPTAAPATEAPTAVPATEAPTAVPATEAPTAAPATEAPTTVPPTAAPAVNVPAVQDVEGAEEGEVQPTAVPPTPNPAQPTPVPRPPRPTPTPAVFQPPAVVATAPVQVASTPAVQTAALQCSGVIGEMDDDGVPSRLPRQLQYAGQSWAFTGPVSSEGLGDTREISCVGPFVVIQVEGSDTLYLGIQNATDTLYAFERTTAFTVQSQTRDTQTPNRLAMPDTDSGPGATYRASEPMVPTSYSSISMVLYVSDAGAATHDRILGHSVANDAFGEFVPEGQAEPAGQEVIDRAAQYGIPSQFVIGSQRYVLVALWTPFGTTTNGWLTLYGVDGEAAPGQLIGLDPRRTDLLVFNRDD